ncbi:hypothetical protein I204_08131 [Kwoniella mangroviensis CBS 8886]|uniref:uncharacterized protein n=1 Tax=Kwoniella mangroviensis CBS 8507 TaxID=1296122 RepID=UPI00080CCB83|nr:uncharacterized protein I203_04509 [Kwoniella mangroviensis CBS 8507]OCF66183.1 hypothetical protein I203_04509 [Kwoniella mangroviensis CBS 8507]OCF71178.1 hypothetical protein I204_08131 [Kwoniella mangroviensis CBS 8886]
MLIKRELQMDDYLSNPQSEDTKPIISSLETPKPKKSKSNTSSTPSSSNGSATPSPTKRAKSKASPSTVDQDGLSAKGKFAIMIIEKDIEALKKDEVEAATGLTSGQQRDLVRKDAKGALRKSLMAVAEKL